MPARGLGGLLNGVHCQLTEYGEMAGLDAPRVVDGVVGGPPHCLPCCLRQLHCCVPVYPFLHSRNDYKYDYLR